jgi:hypothetical protein
LRLSQRLVWNGPEDVMSAVRPSAKYCDDRADRHSCARHSSRLTRDSPRLGRVARLATPQPLSRSLDAVRTRMTRTELDGIVYDGSQVLSVRDLVFLVKTIYFVPWCAQDARIVGMSAQPADSLSMCAQTGHRLSEACTDVHRFCALSGHSTSMKPGNNCAGCLMNDSYMQERITPVVRSSRGGSSRERNEPLDELGTVARHASHSDARLVTCHHLLSLASYLLALARRQYTIHIPTSASLRINRRI